MGLMTHFIRIISLGSLTGRPFTRYTTAMNIKKFFLTASSVLGLASSALLADNPVDPFIDLSSGNVKVVFTQVVINTQTVTLATATTSETDTGAGTITVKKMTYVVAPIPDGSGGFDYERRVTQELTVATLTAPGVYSVDTTTNLLTTPVDVNDSPLGATDCVETVVNETGVDEDDLDLPPSTEFFPLDEELDTPVVISPA